MMYTMTYIMKTTPSQRLFTGLLLAVLLLSSVGAAPAAANSGPIFSPQSFESFFHDFIGKQIAADPVAGAAVAIVQGGQLVFSGGYGYADATAHVPVQADRTLFFIGSDGKLFTWTAVMQLVEQGRLDLHVDVNTYLDFIIPPAFNAPVTLHHLMTHTAGFEEELNALLQNDPTRVLPLGDFVKRFLPQRVYPPGEVSAYSNYGTALAGYIVERVAGQPFEAYLEQHILQPLGMAHSSAQQPLPDDLAAQLSKGHHYQNGIFSAIDFEWTMAAPCAPVRATITDVGRFMQAHLNGGCLEGNCILRPDTLQHMHSQHFTHPGQPSGMAYGFLESRINGQRVLWHLGQSAYFTTVLALVPDQNLGLAVSYNSPPANPRAILFQFMDTFFPASRTALPTQPLASWETRAAQFNGVYLPARSAHTSPQKLLAALESLPVKIEQGQVSAAGWDFIETNPGIFQQMDGDRVLTFWQDAGGRRWMAIGPLAYFQAKWFESPTFSLLLLAFGLLVLLPAWLGWPVWAARRRRQGLAVQNPGALWLAALLGLFTWGLLIGLAALLLGFQRTFVFPDQGVRQIANLLWLTVPGALLVTLAAGRAWRRRDWPLPLRLHYSLAALGALALVWLLWANNLIGG
jgi:CubicO group peptidase (beta-lactamase class C family)